MGDCHPILAGGTPLFPTRVPRWNRWLSMAVPFFRVVGLVTQRMRFTVEATKKALAGLNVRSQCRRVKGVCRGGCFRGLLVEVSLALVGVASPAMFKLYQTSYHYASPNPKYYRFVAKKTVRRSPRRCGGTARASVSHLPGALANAARGAMATKFRCKSGSAISSLTLFVLMTY